MKTAGIKKGSSGSSRGFTLVEIMISIAISMIVALAIYSVYSTFYRQTATQDLMLEAQQNARVGINLMERELINAGYNAGTNVITVATPTSVTFAYSEPTGTTDLLRVTYNYDAGAKNLTRQQTNVTTGAVGATEVLVPNVASLTIAYYNENGVSIPAPINPAALVGTDLLINTVKFIDITLTTETKSIPPGSAAKKTFMLETHLRLRSIGIGQTAADETPPDAPTALAVREVANPAGAGGSCGKLQVRFTGSAAGDVSGYKIYYGVAPNSYTGVINVPTTQLTGSQYVCTKSGSTFTCTITPTTVALTPTLSFTGGAHSPANAVIYYFAAKAYDNSLNASEYSAAAFGDASTATIATSNYSFASGSNDSTINAGKPAAITSFTAADGAADGKVNLTWSLYSASSNPGVDKLRIYRSTSAFTYPVDSATQIAEITTPGSTTAYTDSNLTGCTLYYYAIAPVNCDTSLITSDAGDTANEQYASTDYGVSYGDGAGAGADLPVGADSSPPDVTPPGTPLISKRGDGSIVSGYKRTYITFTNPADSDFSHTLIYYNTSAGAANYPTVDTTIGSPTYGVISNGNPVPDSNVSWKGIKGRFETANATVSFIHDSEYTAAIEDVNWVHAPLLSQPAYFYVAVAYDKCGNPRMDSGSAQTLATLCGDGSVGSPEYGPPAAPPLGVSSWGCYSGDNYPWAGVQIYWNPITTSATENPDAAGYRVYRSPSAPFNTAVLKPSDLNATPCSSNPASSCYLGFIPIGSGTTFYDNYGLTDTGVTKYSYGIATTDCVYEERWIPNAEVVFRNNYSPWRDYNGALGAGVTPGMVDRDEAANVAKDAHRATLTGVSIDNSAGSGTGAITPSSTFRHDTATIFAENTANGTQSLNYLYIYWVNPSARLTNVAVGGGRSGAAVINTAVPAFYNWSAAGWGMDPYMMFGYVPLPNIQLPANARNIPITLTFDDGAGGPIDMRGDDFIVYLYNTNDSTGTTWCSSYLTVSKYWEWDGVSVSDGPTVNSVTQSNPSSPTFVYAVPGSGGSNTVPTDGVTYGTIQATGGTDTVITANISAGTLDETTGGTVAVSSAVLYYQQTALTVGTAPASGYTTLAMVNTAGNTWTGTIPQMVGASARRFWFYIVAKDADGNYDRAPEIAEGAYTFDQKPFGVCDVTPKAPTGLTTYSVSATQAAFSWPRVTQYSNNNPIAATDTLYYRVYRRNSLTGAFTKLLDVPDNATGSWVSATATAPATSARYVCELGALPGKCIWEDTIDANTNDLTYYVQSKNSCGADLNLSAQTGNWRECQGSTAAVIDVSPATINTNGTYTVTINDCSKSGNALSDVDAVHNIASIGATDFTSNITETAGDTGVFTASVLAQNAGAADTTGVYVSPTNLANDIVTVSCSVANGCSGPPTNATVTVTARACDFAPSQVAGLALTKVSTGSPKGIRLNWTASADTDPPYYSIYGKLGAGTYSLLTTVPAGTTTWLHEPAKTNGQTWYYYIVATDACPLSGAASAVQSLTW